MPKKICITGHSRRTFPSIPFSDRGWDIWGLNGKFDMYPRFDRWFEVHSYDRYWSLVCWEKYLEFLLADQEKVWLSKADCLLPNANVLPVSDIKQVLSVDRLSSSFMYMIGTAILEGVDEILIAGIDLEHPTEYGSQRPGVMYSINVALRNGIRIFLPSNSFLLESYTDIQREKLKGGLVEVHKVPNIPAGNPLWDYGLEKSQPVAF